MSVQQSQYLRKWQLVVANSEKILDLSQFRIVFNITAEDLETPNEAFIRVYNLALPRPGVTAPGASIDTSEFSSVSLQAGYEAGPFGSIFNGTIKQFRRGREEGSGNVNTYLDILAADGDAFYNSGFTNTKIPAGTPQAAIVAAGLASASQTVPTGLAKEANLTGGIEPLPRGKVMVGLTREFLRHTAWSNGWSWSIQNGKVLMYPETGYVDGEAVVLSAATGMIGLPEQTDQGINIKCLLNPKIKVGTRVQINNVDIPVAALPINKGNFAVGAAEIASKLRIASLSYDGFYRVLVVEYQGDTRGDPWYCTLTCLALNPSTNPLSAVPAGGGLPQGAPANSGQELG